MNYIILFIFLFIIIHTYPILIYDCNKQIKYRNHFLNKKPFIINNFYDKNILNIFTPTNLLEKFSDFKIEISEYKKNEFYSIKNFVLSLKDFINKKFIIDNNNKYQGKLYITPDSLFDNLIKINVDKYFTAGTILNDTIYIKKNNLNTHYKNLGISANVNLASRNINTSEPSRNGDEFKLPLHFLL